MPRPQLARRAAGSCRGGSTDGRRTLSWPSTASVERLAEALVEVNKTGLSILVVEQDVLTAFDFVIELGRIGMSGETRLLAEDQKIRQAYMGI